MRPFLFLFLEPRISQPGGRGPRLWTVTAPSIPRYLTSGLSQVRGGFMRYLGKSKVAQRSRP